MIRIMSKNCDVCVPFDGTTFYCVTLTPTCCYIKADTGSKTVYPMAEYSSYAIACKALKFTMLAIYEINRKGINDIVVEFVNEQETVKWDGTVEGMKELSR